MLLNAIAVTAVVFGGPSPPGSTAACQFHLETRVYLPVEVGHGPVLGSGSPVPWTFSVRAHPTLAFGGSGRVRLGPVLGASYVNPGWEGMAGVRLGYRLFQAPLDLFAFELAGEAVWGVDGRRPWAAAATLDVGNVLTLNARGFPNLGTRPGFVEVGVGVHVLTIVRVLLPSDTTEPDIEIPSENSAFADFARYVTKRILLAAFYADVDEKPHIRCEVVRLFARLLEEEENAPSTTLADLDNRVMVLVGEILDIEGHEDAVVERVTDEHLPGARVPPDEEIIRALLMGVREAVEAAYASSLPTI